MIVALTQIALALSTVPAAAPEQEKGLVARYTFDEGRGTALTNHGGNGHGGTIHGAEWVPSARGRTLAFQQTGSHVDCGLDLGRRLVGDMTLVAWVRLTPRAYPDGSTNWTIADCEDYTWSAETPV